MTPLQEFFGSIWALVPGLIPSLFIVWVVAACLALASLAIDEYNGETPKRPMLSTALYALRIGIMFTIVVIFSEARAKGLISMNQFGIATIAALFSGMSFTFTKSLKKAQPARMPRP